MRLVSLLFTLLLVLPGTAIAQGPSSEPIGTLAEVMRGLLFPASNRLADVQTVDPETRCRRIPTTTGLQPDSHASTRGGQPLITPPSLWPKWQSSS